MTEITAKLSTALADRYKIERHLGEGGMANVYLAEARGTEAKCPVGARSLRSSSRAEAGTAWGQALGTSQPTTEIAVVSR